MMNNLLSTIVLALCAMAAFPNAIAAPSPVPLALEVETAQIGKRTTASFAETCRGFILSGNTLRATCRTPQEGDKISVIAVDSCVGNVNGDLHA
jgi:hypothetical protein